MLEQSKEQKPLLNIKPSKVLPSRRLLKTKAQVGDKPMPVNYQTIGKNLLLEDF